MFVLFIKNASKIFKSGLLILLQLENIFISDWNGWLFQMMFVSGLSMHEIMKCRLIDCNVSSMHLRATFVNVENSVWSGFIRIVWFCYVHVYGYEIS